MSYDIDITKTPPANEPERQYYYMAKAKDFVEKKSKEIGRPMTYFVKTFGCQMNARDSETYFVKTFGCQMNSKNKMPKTL